MLHMLRLILVLSLPFSSAFAADKLTETVTHTMKKAESVSSSIQLPDTAVHEQGLKTAQKTFTIYNSPKFQEKLRCEQKRLREDVFQDFSQENETKGLAPGKLAHGEKIYLFLSSSIPQVTVNNYFQAVEDLNEPNLSLLMRGYSPGKRTDYLIQITKKDAGCIDQLRLHKPVLCERFKTPIRIRPELFEKYQVTQVPALVYEQGKKAWKITGDAKLDYLLEKINEEAKSSGLTGFMAALQGKTNE